MSGLKILIDCSGSTGHRTSYWNSVGDIANNNSDAQFYFWDDKCKKTDFKDVLARVQSCSGGGGTSPSCFISHLDKNDHIMIITDGQVSQHDIAVCDKKLDGFHFSSVTVHFINTGGQMNLTVSAPFTRNCKNFELFVDNVSLSSGSSLIDIDLSIYFNNLDKFLSESDELFKQIVIKNLGKRNESLRNQLLDLQKNLMKCVAEKNITDVKYDQLRKLLLDNTYDNAIATVKEIITRADTTLGQKIEEIIREMTKQCEGQNDFSFSLLQPGRLTRAINVKQVAIEEAPAIEDYQGSFECPIMLDNNSPVLLVTDDTPLLSQCEKSQLDALMTNPLLMLLDHTLVAKLKERLDHPFGLEASQQLFAQDNVKSPMTSKPISCAMTFGAHPTHTKATNYTLAKLLFGGKLVGIPELWLSVIYFVMKSIPYLAENNGLMDAVKNHMMYRMKSKSTNMTLSGLPIEPLIKCPIDVAIWYCVVSPFIMENPTADRLRSFGPVAKYLIELVEMLGYPYDKQWTQHRLCLYKAFTWMMNEDKNNTAWRKLLRAQYQNSLVLDNGTIILLDGPNNNPPHLPNFRVTDQSPTLSLEELITLSKLVDKSKTNTAVPIPLIFIPNTIPSPVTNYGYPDGLSCEEINATKICPRTLRPYTIDLVKHKHWKICCEEIYGPLSKQISNYNYYIRYVMDNDKYPTRQEFIEYVAAKQENKENPLDTLPKRMNEFVNNLFSNYEPIIGNMSTHEFKRITYASMSKEERAKMDETCNL